MNGKKWTGKIYEENDNIIELKNGKGYYKSYNGNGGLVLEYEILNGEPTGKVRNYYNNNNLGFEGEYINNCANGKCKRYYESGTLEF